MIYRINFPVLYFALLISVFSANAVNITGQINRWKHRAYDIRAKSSAYSDGEDCEIVINGSPNLCQNNRGHNIVVIDKVKNEYESVNFDTYKSEDEAKKMVDYLKEVKANNMVIIAVKDSTWPWHFKQEWIKYVDKLGSRTHQNTSEQTIDYEEGCPFTGYRRAFVLISEKLGLLYNGEQGWSMRRRCEHGEHSAEAHYLVELHQHCSENRALAKCKHQYGGSLPMKHEMVKHDGDRCYAVDECQSKQWCERRYSVEKDEQINDCQMEGWWSDRFKCPKCVSRFGIERARDSKTVYIKKGQKNTIKFKFTTVKRPKFDMNFVIKFNETDIAAYDPYRNYNYKWVKHDPNHHGTIVRNKRFDYDTIRYTMSWTVNNATMDYDNSKVEFQVVDVKGGYIEKPRVIHNYVKNIKISKHQDY